MQTGNGFQVGLYSPQGKSLLNFLEKIGVKLVQRFKVREYETFQGFGHGVVFADCALKPLGTKGNSSDVRPQPDECLRALSMWALLGVEAGPPAAPPHSEGKGVSLFLIALSSGSPRLVQAGADLLDEQLLEPSPHQASSRGNRGCGITGCPLGAVGLPLHKHVEQGVAKLPVHGHTRHRSGNWAQDLQSTRHHLIPTLWVSLFTGYTLSQNHGVQVPRSPQLCF